MLNVGKNKVSVKLEKFVKMDKSSKNGESGKSCQKVVKFGEIC